MAGTDNTKCSSCGETFYDRPDRVGTVCPLCWEEQQLAVAAEEAKQAAEDAKDRLDERRKEHKAQQKELAKSA